MTSIQKNNVVYHMYQSQTTFMCAMLPILEERKRSYGFFCSLYFYSRTTRSYVLPNSSSRYPGVEHETTEQDYKARLISDRVRRAQGHCCVLTHRQLFQVLTLFSASNYYEVGSNKGAFAQLLPMPKELMPHIIQYIFTEATGLKKLTIKQRYAIDV